VRVGELCIAVADDAVAFGKRVRIGIAHRAGRWPMSTVCKTARPPQRLFHLVFESHDGRCYGAAARILHSIVADVNRWSAP
jgi:hypothetical protein